MNFLACALCAYGLRLPCPTGIALERYSSSRMLHCGTSYPHRLSNLPLCAARSTLLLNRCCWRLGISTKRDGYVWELQATNRRFERGASFPFHKIYETLSSTSPTNKQTNIRVPALTVFFSCKFACFYAHGLMVYETIVWAPHVAGVICAR